MKEIQIGVLGGMGTYATIHLFQQYAKIFNAKKEWDRPRLVIDNRCTMPSRVCAFLYGENEGKLIDDMIDSLTRLMEMGCNKIILDCNTSHLFLDRIFQVKPELENIIVNLIDICVEQIAVDAKKEIYLLGSEGTIDSRLYQNALSRKNIQCITPQPHEYSQIRKCIEAVKTDNCTEETKSIFLNLINNHKNCILGCTELPILADLYADSICCEKLYDPVLICLHMIKERFENE